MADIDMRKRLAEVHAYAVTPFLAGNGSAIDFDGFRDNLRFMADQGVRVIAVGGGTGEIEALLPEELEGLAGAALDTVGDRLLVIGCLPPNLGMALRLAPLYEQLGVQVMMAVAPQVRWREPVDLEGTFEYYSAIAASCDLPFLLYRIQPWPAEFIARLGDIDQVLGIKDPCYEPLEFFRAIQQMGDRFVWIGNKQHDPGVLHLRYQMGIEGFTSGQLNYLPGPELQMHEAAVRRDWDEMVRLQAQVAPLERARRMFDDTAMVKAAMDFMGLRGGAVRSPRRNLDEASRDAVGAALVEVGVLPESSDG
ncbi:MAG: hypothetical protein BMS9Abin12_1003 [Acidimicrobiia bacterium]|nr:MAG: hypothetical protein BMS9Abin12_1003 [Acidimicrobiia bacterium]